MKKKIDLATAENITPDEIISGINTGIEIIGKAEPILKLLFDKISDAIKNIGGPKSPQARLKRIEALEEVAKLLQAKDGLQKELNKSNEARLAAIEARVKAIEEKLGL